MIIRETYTVDGYKTRYKQAGNGIFLRIVPELSPPLLFVDYWEITLTILAKEILQKRPKIR